MRPGLLSLLPYILKPFEEFAFPKQKRVNVSPYMELSRVYSSLRSSNIFSIESSSLNSLTSGLN